MENLLEIKNLSIGYHTDFEDVQAVRNLNLTIKQGETLGLVGETGAGKTTIAKAILRILQAPPARYQSGEILYRGEDLLKASKRQMRKIRGEEISMIFQDPMTSLNPVVEVIDQIAEVYRIHEKISREDAHKKAVEILNMVGIKSDRVREYPHQFSGGMKQRVVIAMALANSPKLLLADEPTSALDVTIQAQIIRLIADLKERLGTSMLLITHDLGVVAQTCDRVAIIYAGSIVETGSLEQIFNDRCHPYTVGLFNCIPDLTKHSQTLKPITGLMPDPSNLPTGCAFYDRCPIASEDCKLGHGSGQTGDIPLQEIEPGHSVACLHYEKMRQSNGK